MREVERGFSVLELVLSMGILAVLSLLMFVLFQSSVDQFAVGAARGDLQSQIHRATRSLRRDLARSSRASLLIEPRSVTVGAQLLSRDRLSFAALSDWNNPSLFTASGLPRWDRQLVYAAVPDEKSGILGYAQVNPRAGTAQNPWTPLRTMTVPPLSQPSVTRWTVLAESLRSFSVRKKQQGVQFELVLATRGTPDSKRAGERLALDFTLEVANP